MHTSEETPDVLETSVLDVIEHSDVSVRLLNAIRNAASNGGLPLATVGDYLTAGPMACSRFMSLQNLGRKSATELDLVIRAFAARNEKYVPIFKSPPDASYEEQVRRALLNMFSALSFPDVISDFPISARLRNAFKAHPHLCRPFSAYLNDPEPVFTEILELPNLGKASVAELHALTSEITGKLLQNKGFTESDAADALGLLFKHHIPDPLVLQRLEAGATQDGPITEAALSGEKDNKTLSLIVTELLSAMDSRSREVVERRYGIGRANAETLEEIGADHRITRERIRQIEAKALRQLGLPSRERLLRSALSAEAKEMILRAAGGASYITDADKPALLRRLEPCVRLAIDVVYRKNTAVPIADQFLKSAAIQWKNGWLLAQQSVAELDHVLDQIKFTLAKICLPAAVREVVEFTDEDMALTALRLGTDLPVFEGYVLPGRAGPRRRRTVRLHKHLVGSGRLQEIRDLIAIYLRAVSTDHCSVRDAEIVMSEAPHLFLRIVDEAWYAVGSAPRVEPMTDEASVTTDDTNDVGEPEDIIDSGEEANIRTILRNELIERGPLRFTDLRNSCAKHLDGKSISSIGPILLTSGDFVRPLPGTYALPEQLPSSAILPFEPPPFLLTEDQARWLAMARYAGEPFGRYAMWTPAAEYALCRWCQNNASPIVFQSLLAVASIHQWPVSAETYEHWKALRRKEGVYGLAVLPRYPLRQLWPPLDRVLAACILASRDSGLSWITANRVLKRRLDAHVAAGLLALMVLSGALEPTPHWQLRHQNGTRLGLLIDRLSAQLHLVGGLEWSSSAGQELLDELKIRRLQHLDGWVTNDLAADLIAGSDIDAPSELANNGDADEPISSLEALLAERRRKQDAETMRETLSSILGSKA